MTTGDRIRYYRKMQNISQETLAERLGITRQAIAKWESGKSSPGTENLLRTAKILNVSVDDLAGLEDNPPEGGAEENRKAQAAPRLILKLLLALTLIFIVFILSRQFTGNGDSQLIFDGIITLVNLWFLAGFIYIIIMIIKALKKYLSD